MKTVELITNIVGLLGLMASAILIGAFVVALFFKRGTKAERKFWNKP